MTTRMYNPSSTRRIMPWLHRLIHVFSFDLSTLTVSCMHVRLHTVTVKAPQTATSMRYFYNVFQNNAPTLKWYSSKLYGSILMIFGRNI